MTAAFWQIQVFRILFGSHISRDKSCLTVRYIFDLNSSSNNSDDFVNENWTHGLAGFVPAYE